MARTEDDDKVLTEAVDISQYAKVFADKVVELNKLQRRGIIILLSPEALVAALAGQIKLGGISSRRDGDMKPLPSDLSYCDVFFDWETNCFAVRLCSSTFPVTSDGYKFPQWFAHFDIVR